MIFLVQNVGVYLIISLKRYNPTKPAIRQVNAIVIIKYENMNQTLYIITFCFPCQLQSCGFKIRNLCLFHFKKQKKMLTIYHCFQLIHEI